MKILSNEKGYTNLQLIARYKNVNLELARRYTNTRQQIVLELRAELVERLGQKQMVQLELEISKLILESGV